MQIQLGLKHLEGGSLIPFNACIGRVTVHTIISFTKSNAVKTKSRFWENVDSLILHCRQRDVTIHTYISFIKNNCSKKQDLDLRNVDSVTLQRRQKEVMIHTFISSYKIKCNNNKIWIIQRKQGNAQQPRGHADGNSNVKRMQAYISEHRRRANA